MQSEIQPEKEEEFVFDTPIEEEPWFEHLYDKT
jgi:hypothetical protein